MLKSNLTEWLVIVLVVMVICLNRMDTLRAQSEGTVASSVDGSVPDRVNVVKKNTRFVTVKNDKGDIERKEVAFNQIVTMSFAKSVVFKKNQLQETISQVSSQLKTSQDQAEKEALKENLRKELQEFYELELSAREFKLKPLEDRVKKLRGQIDKRRAAKEEIVDLQLQLIMNQAEGLGYFSEPRTTIAVTPFARGGTQQFLREAGPTNDLEETPVPAQVFPPVQQDEVFEPVISR